MPDKQPITIQHGSFVCSLFDINNLMDLPLAKLHKLWKIMFSAASENAATIHAITAWLLEVIYCTEVALQAEQTRSWQVSQYVNALSSKVAAFGSVATKEQQAELKEAITVLRYAEKLAKDAKTRHERAKKLQIIFNQLTTN